MLINNNSQGEVKFVSYTGKYPNLCSGVLTLSIHEKEYVFGYNFQERKGETLYPPFWRSGGNCGFTDNYSNAYVNECEWVIDGSQLPPELRKYATEINEVFNENVRFGCCGGCL